MTKTEIDREIYVAKWQTEGRDPNGADWAYWREKAPEMIARGYELNYRSPTDPSITDAGRAYFRERLIGWQAQGADLPSYGPYSARDVAFHSVPSAGPGPEPEQPPPATVQSPAIDVQAIHDKLDTIIKALPTLATKDDIKAAREEFVQSVKTAAATFNPFRR